MLRSQILAAAGRLFVQKGYDNVTLRAIAEEIGYSHATIYQYFRDKAEILQEICVEAFMQMLGDFNAIAEATPEPVERLFATSRGIIRFCLAHPEHIRAVFLGPEDRDGTKAGELISRVGQPVFDRLIEVFVAAAAKNRTKLQNPRQSSFTWGHSLFGLSLSLIVQGQMPEGHPFAIPQDEVIDQLLAWMWKGVSSGVNGTHLKEVNRRSGSTLK